MKSCGTVLPGSWHARHPAGALDLLIHAVFGRTLGGDNARSVVAPLAEALRATVEAMTDASQGFHMWEEYVGVGLVGP
jgi:hypothetical protein